MNEPTQPLMGGRPQHTIDLANEALHHIDETFEKEGLPILDTETFDPEFVDARDSMLSFLCARGTLIRAVR